MFKLNTFVFELFVYLIYLNLWIIGNTSCPSHQFSLPEMDECVPLLNCEDMKYVKPLGLIVHGNVKNVWMAEWNNHRIVMYTLANSDYLDDFQEHLKNLQFFKNSDLVTNWIGSCGTTILTQYYPYGSMNNLVTLLDRYRVLRFTDRLKHCVQYVSILILLHNHSMVMCDSSSLEKTLSQYLVTEQMNLVLNDLDALPRISPHEKIICGRRALIGDLVSPEQRWPYPNRTYNPEQMQRYDEKSDLWKVPDVCHHVLGSSRVPPLARQMLYWIHTRCKSNDPNSRPTAYYVYHFYLLLMQIFSNV